MEEKLNKLNIFFLIQTLIIGGNGVIVARIVTKSADTGAWFVIIICTILASLLASLYVFLGLNFRGMAITEYCVDILGKSKSMIIFLILIVFFYIDYIRSLAHTSFITSYDYLPKTPMWALRIAIVLTAFYCIFKGLNSISKVSIFYSIINYVLVPIFFFLIVPNIKVLELFPLFNFESLDKYAVSIFDTIGSFNGILYLSIIPFSKEYDFKKIYWYTIGSIICVGIIYLLYTEVAIGFLGRKEILKFNATSLMVGRITEGGFTELTGRIDGILFVFFLSFNIIKCIVSVYAISKLIKTLINSIPIKLIYIIVFLLGFLNTFLFKDMTNMAVLTDINKYVGLFAMAAIPMLLIIVYKIKKVNIV